MVFTEVKHRDGLAQDCINSSTLAMDLLQSYTDPPNSLFSFKFHSYLLLGFHPQEIKFGNVWGQNNMQFRHCLGAIYSMDISNGITYTYK